VLSCQQIKFQWLAYLDGELAAPQQRTMRDHLATCHACSEHVRQVQALEAQLYAEAAIQRDECDALDIVRDVFAYVLDHIHDYQGEVPFSTRLMAIAVNQCSERLRRRRVRQTLPLHWPNGGPSEVELAGMAGRKQQRQTLWPLVERLDDAHRLPVILRYRECLPCQEVARVLALHVSAIYARLNAAREQLRAMFQEQTSIE
jgi:RNA polymerase sigma-70 factor (ECF subfamily)